MSNLFDTDKEIDIRYDLKGSLYKRETISNDRKVARKDKNFLQDQFKLELSEPQFSELSNQIEADSKFFAENDLIDYSLLLGVYKRKRDGNLPLCNLKI